MALNLTRSCLMSLPKCSYSIARASRRVLPTTYQQYNHVRLQTSEAIQPPHIEGADKDFPPKIQKIVEDISQLTLLEVADLNELLKKTLNISDAPVMMGAVAAGPAQAQDEEEVEEKVEKVIFTVKIMKYDEKKKVALIKEIKSNVEGMNLVQAKKFVESAPAEVKKDIPKEEAEALKKVLEAVGAEVVIE